jgi:hypothetical protein
VIETPNPIGTLKGVVKLIEFVGLRVVATSIISVERQYLARGMKSHLKTIDDRTNLVFEAVLDQHAMELIRQCPTGVGLGNEVSQKTFRHW